MIRPTDKGDEFMAEKEDLEMKWYHKLIGILGVAFLLSIPFFAFALIFGLFFAAFGLYHHQLTFANYGSLLQFGALFFISMIVIEFMGKMILMASKAFFDKQISWPTQNIFTILSYMVVIYFLANHISFVSITSWWTALALSIIIHITNWILEAMMKLRGKMKKEK